MHSGYPFPHRALSRPIIKTAFMDNASERPTIFLLVMLAALTVFAPFVTDMYMSTLPSMTESFSATASQVQLGLTASMPGLAL